MKKKKSLILELPPTAPPKEERGEDEFDDYRIIDTVKDYFGEDIGIYFSFVGFYTKWLLYASIVGLITLIVA